MCICHHSNERSTMGKQKIWLPYLWVPMNESTVHGISSVGSAFCWFLNWLHTIIYIIINSTISFLVFFLFAIAKSAFENIHVSFIFFLWKFKHSFAWKTVLLSLRHKYANSLSMHYILNAVKIHQLISNKIV